MAEDPNKQESPADNFAEEPTRDLSELDINEDGVIDPIEAAVASEPVVDDPDPAEQAPSEPEVELQRPAAVESGMQLAQPKRSWLSRFVPRSRRERQIQTLQAGYGEMVDMMRSISHHLERQSNIQDTLVQALEHFPEAVESLQSVGKASEKQTEVLGMVKDQLETSAAHEQQVVDGMNRFNNTLTIMDETSKTTSDTIETLVDRSRESEENLRAMLERSERRTTLLLGFLGLLTIGAIGVALYVGVSGRSIDLKRFMGTKGNADRVHEALTDLEPQAYPAKTGAEGLLPAAGPAADSGQGVAPQGDTVNQEVPTPAPATDDAAKKTDDAAKKVVGSSESATKDSVTKSKIGEPANEATAKKTAAKKAAAKKKAGAKKKAAKEDVPVEAVKAVKASAAQAASETGVTAGDAAASAVVEAAGGANVDAPALDKELSEASDKLAAGKELETTPKKKRKKNAAADAESVNASGESESIVKKVVAVLAGSDEAESPPDVKIEPVEK